MEVFLLICGAAAILISQNWSGHLLKEALISPLKISAAVLVAGLLFRKFHSEIYKITDYSLKKIGLKMTLFLTVFALGLASSVITAIVAALILGEIVCAITLKKSTQIKLIIYTCFAISAGSVLTPIGEPLGAIVIEKLRGEPHNADTLFMVRMLWPYILSAILFLSMLAYRLGGEKQPELSHETCEVYPLRDVFIRTLKVYIFVIALIFLGEGLKPVAYKTIYHFPPQALYWVNIISAVLDNATLAAVEVVPAMSVKTLTYLIMSLVLGGGLLIQGNIPNIIVASKLKIKSRQWARTAMPLGLGLLAAYFIILLITV